MSFDFSAHLSSADLLEARRAGETIFQMGEAGRVLYIVQSGEAQIRVGDMVLETARKGDIIGEMALLDENDEARSATAVALTDCEIAPVNRARLMEMVREQPLLALEISRLIARRLRSMNFLAHHDSLTRLPNRSLFQEQCLTAIKRAQRRSSTIGVLFIDLDHFKTINESLGYGAGDELLRTVAARLQGVLHELDILARLSADEFAVLLEDVGNSESIAAVAHRIVGALGEPFRISNQDIYISASVGIGCYPQDGEDPQTLIKNADTAMRRAKEGGRNSYSFFSAELNALAVEGLTLRNNLHRALERREFTLVYQPRVDITSGKIMAVEALIRWRHPHLGMVPPGKFIPIAENAGMIEAIGEWVLRTACTQWMAWSASGLGTFRLAVNLSMGQLRRADLKQRIAAILADTGFKGSDLELEVTESAMMEDSVKVVHLLKELRALGIAIALDDFGTEYSSLGYLKHFQLDVMKIDRSFISGIPGASDDVAIAKTIMTLARNLQLRVVAEGVETEAQLAFLKEQGCEEYQGYLFSTPLPAAELETLVRRPAA